MAINNGMNFKSAQEAFEAASMMFYRIERLATATMRINELRDGDFKDNAYKEDCVHIQLEHISELAERYYDVFSELEALLNKSQQTNKKSNLFEFPRPADQVGI